MKSKEGFQKSVELKGVQGSHQDKTFYVIDRLADKLDLSCSKVEEAKDLFSEVSVTNLKKGNIGVCDHLVLGGALLFIASRNQPVDPRWESLIADKCSELASEEARPSRPSKSFSNGGYSFWEKELHDMVSALKDQGLDVNDISALNYIYFMAESEGLRQSVKAYCVSRMALLENDPEFQSKKRVTLAAALLATAVENLSEREADLEGLAERFSVSIQTLESYSEKLEEKLFKSEGEPA